MQEFDPSNINEIDLSQNKKGPNVKRILTSIVCVLLVVVIAVAAALLVKKYVITTFIVDGISMYPTLDGGAGANMEGSSESERTNGEVLYLNKIADIKRGDIVVFDSEALNQILVKRVIAVAGDRLQIVDNIVYLNGQKLDEGYIKVGSMISNGNVDVTVPDGYIFCMGDNRNHSTDSRAFGVVSLDKVIGKCFMIKGLDGKIRMI